VNTLRQRLERIEKLAGLVLSGEDLIALQLAIKLAHVHRVPAYEREEPDGADTGVDDDL